MSVSFVLVCSPSPAKVSPAFPRHMAGLIPTDVPSADEPPAGDGAHSEPHAPASSLRQVVGYTYHRSFPVRVSATSGQTTSSRTVGRASSTDQRR